MRPSLRPDVSSDAKGRTRCWLEREAKGILAPPLSRVTTAPFPSDSVRGVERPPARRLLRRLVHASPGRRTSRPGFPNRTRSCRRRTAPPGRQVRARPPDQRVKPSNEPASSLGHHAPSRLSAAVLPAAVGCMPIEGIGPVVLLLGFYPVVDLGLGPHDRLAPRPSEPDALRKPTGALKRIQPGRAQSRAPQDLGTTKKDIGHGASPFLAVAGATREALSTCRTAEFTARCPGKIGTIFSRGLGEGSRGMPG